LPTFQIFVHNVTLGPAVVLFSLQHFSSSEWHVDEKPTNIFSICPSSNIVKKKGIIWFKYPI